MTEPRSLPGALTPAFDSDDDDPELVDGADDLPDDVPNDALSSEMQVPAGGVADTDVDAPVDGRPLTDEEIGG